MVTIGHIAVQSICGLLLLYLLPHILQLAMPLKVYKSLYLICNSLTECQKIWHGDAHWSSQPCYIFEFLAFQDAGRLPLIIISAKV